MTRIPAKSAFTAALLAAAMSASSPARAQFDAMTMDRDLRGRIEFEAIMRPTYLECPDSPSQALTYAEDSASGRSVQMKVVSGWLHLGVREPGDQAYRQVRSEMAKIDELDQHDRSRMQKARSDYEYLLGLCQGPEEPRKIHSDRLEINRRTVHPLWLATGRPWPLETGPTAPRTP